MLHTHTRTHTHTHTHTYTHTHIIYITYINTIYIHNIYLCNIYWHLHRPTAEERVPFFSISTHSQTYRHLVYQDVYRLFLIDLLEITRFIADDIYPHSGFVFNYIFIDVIYSEFKVIDFSVILNRQSVDSTLVLKTEQWTSREVKTDIKRLEIEERGRQIYEEFILLKVNGVSDEKDA